MISYTFAGPILSCLLESQQERETFQQKLQRNPQNNPQYSVNTYSSINCCSRINVVRFGMINFTNNEDYYDIHSLFSVGSRVLFNDTKDELIQTLGSNVATGLEIQHAIARRSLIGQDQVDGSSVNIYETPVWKELNSIYYQDFANDAFDQNI